MKEEHEKLINIQSDKKENNNNDNNKSNISTNLKINQINKYLNKNKFESTNKKSQFETNYKW